MPKGATIIASKRDNDGDFMVLGNKKSKGKKPQQPKLDSNKPIKMDLEMIDVFSKLNISIPVSVAQAREAVVALEAKKMELIAGQAKQTKLNKEAALARVAKLREAAEAEAAAVEVEAEAVVEVAEE
jgi:hypothetical protein